MEIDLSDLDDKIVDYKEYINSEINSKMKPRQDKIDAMKSQLEGLVSQAEVLAQEIKLAKQDSVQLPSVASPGKPKVGDIRAVEPKGAKGLTSFARNLPRVAKLDVKAEELLLNQQIQEKRELFTKTRSKYPECRTTVFAPSWWDSENAKPGNSTSFVELEFVHGYHNTWCIENSNAITHTVHGNDHPHSTSTNNVFYLDSGEIVYYTSGVVIIYDPVEHAQRFFLGPDDLESAVEVSSIAVCPDARMVASGYVGRSAVIYIWDSHTKGKAISSTHTLEGHTMSVRAMDFSHDAKLLVSLGGDVYNTIMVWDWKKESMLTSTRGHSSMVYTIAFNPYQAYGIPDTDGAKPGQSLVEDNACYTLVSCGSRNIRFWTLQKVLHVKEDKDGSAFYGSSFGSPSNPKSKKMQKLVWKLDGLGPDMVGRGEVQDFTCLTFVDDSPPLQQYDPASKKLKVIERTDRTLGRIIVGTSKGDIYIFLQPRKCGSGPDKVLKHAIKWWETSDENVAYETFKWEPTARLLLMIPHDISTGNKYKISKHDQEELEEIERTLRTIPHSKNAKAKKEAIQYDGMLGHDGALLRLCYDPETDLIISSGGDGILMGWQLVLDKDPQVPGVITRGVFYPKNGTEFVEGGHELHQVAGENKKPLEEYLGYGRQSNTLTTVRSISSRNGKFLLGTNTNCIYSIDLSQFKEIPISLKAHLLLESHQSTILAVQSHPSGDLYGTISDDLTFRLWCLRKKVCVASIDLPTKASALCFHPNGNTVAIGTVSSEIIVLNIASYQSGIEVTTRKPVRAPSDGSSPQKTKCNDVLMAAARSISDAKYSPDGTLIVLCARDNCLYLLDVQQGYKRIAVWVGHAGSITHVDWSVDSNIVQSTCIDGELLYWDAKKSIKQLTATINMRDTKWDSWTCTLGWPVQGIWKKKVHNEVTNLAEIASVCKSRGAADSGQPYECVIAAEIKNLKLFHWPCLRGSTCKTYRGHSAAISSVRFSSFDSHVLSAGGMDCSIFQWAHFDQSDEYIQLSIEEFEDINKNGSVCIEANKWYSSVALSAATEGKRRKTKKAAIKHYENPTPPMSNGPASPRGHRKCRNMKGTELRPRPKMFANPTENSATISNHTPDEYDQAYNLQDPSTTSANGEDVGIEERREDEDSAQVFDEEQRYQEATTSYDQASDEPTYRYRALYDFAAESSEELSFRAGDKIAVSKSSGQDSWWFGNLESGEEGYFPLSYVEDLWADSYE